MTASEFDALIERMQRNGVVSEEEMQGCSAAEIAALGRRYGLKLPRSYVRYLERMGHASGKLFATDHVDTEYRALLRLTAEVEAVRHEEVAEGDENAANFVLPDDALVILGRLDEQFHFIRCGDREDSPVWYFNTWHWDIQQTQSSVLDWLDSWCGLSEEAIRSGYFEQYPQGTKP